MNFIKHCPLCGHSGGNIDRMPCCVSPFLASYVFKRDPFPVFLLRCTECRFVFFDGRPDEQEMGILYKGYRGPEYYKVRTACEPGYAAHMPPIERQNIELRRRKRLDDLLAKRNWVFGSGTKALDHGGDSGQFFGDAFALAAKYVYEISGVEPVPGVKALRSDAELKNNSYDFIMSSNVLEHVSDPVGFVKDLKTLGHKNTLFYFEVPCEFPSAWLFGCLKWAKSVLRLFWRGSAGTARSSFGKAIETILMRPWLHEHINFFSPQAMAAALNNAGMTVVYCAVDKTCGEKLGTICCFARMQQ